MKRVSFKVAKALKEVGYPQWSVEEADNSKCAYDCVGELWEIRYFDQHPQDYYTAPYAIEVWLWLWREKKIYLNTNTQLKGIVCVYWDNTIIHKIKDMKLTDPEEAIVSTIEYLVDNDLVK